MSKSHSIKSKAEKKREKKQQKQAQLRSQPIPKNHIQIVVDSQSDHRNDLTELAPQPKKQKILERLEKKKEQSSLPKAENKFNNFNFDRIKKLQSSYRMPPKAAILGVEQSFIGLQKIANQSSKPISYKRAGVTASSTVSEHYLKSRLQKIEQESKALTNLIIQIDPQPKKSEQSQQNGEQYAKEQPIKLKRIPRYFDEEQLEESSDNEQLKDNEEAESKKLIKCYRCGQRGHIARMCNQQQVLKCSYCLGPHHTSDCTDKLCHRCNQKGHIKQQCQSDKIQCKKCRAYGHIGRNCGKIIMMNFRSENQKDIRQRYARQDIEKLKCLKCNGVQDSKGHFNCHQYCRKIPKIYSESYVIL